MNTEQLDRLLADSLADLSVQTAEKKSFVEWSLRHLLDEGERAVARSRAFALARDAITNDPQRVLNWLEDVIRIFARSKPAAEGLNPPEGSRAYFSPGHACIQEVLRRFDEARELCDVCVFTITDDRITNAIIRAHSRGVRVRVITDDLKSHDLGSDIEQLHAAGVDCKMDIGQVAHMHHKYAVFDGRILMNGSFNWTRSASEQNEENLIVTADAVLVTAFAERFELLWQRLRS